VWAGVGGVNPTTQKNSSSCTHRNINDRAVKVAPIIKQYDTLFILTNRARLSLLENKGLRRIFRPKRNEIIKDCRKVYR
jgi:hypothetical protein